MRSPFTKYVRSISVVALMAGAACEREARRLNEKPVPPAERFVAQVSLQPGPTLVTDSAVARLPCVISSNRLCTSALSAASL